MAAAITDYVLPFLVGMRWREAMVQWLTKIQKRYPPEIISRAILQHLVGRSSEACALLADTEKTALGAWGPYAAEVAERLGCRP
jgi:hypothetical protein